MEIVTKLFSKNTSSTSQLHLGKTLQINGTKLRVFILRIAISRPFENTELRYHCYFKGHADLSVSKFLWKMFLF